jgi:predicted dehydrogenase
MALKIGVLGLIHDHVWRHLGDLAARDDVRVAVADPHAPLLAKAREEFGVAQAYGDYAELLDRERPDAVLIMVDNASKADLVELVAGRGLPIMLEKPLADRLANAEWIVAAAERAGVPVMVNWPTAWTPAVRHAIDLAAGGAVGEITRFHFRGGHVGPRAFGCSDYFCDWLYDPARNGAGAYIDYCGYGASIARLLLGPARAAQATIARLRQDDIAVDDNAALTLRWDRAIAVIEATWTAAGPVTDGGPTVAGTVGTLVVRRQSSRREGHVATGGAVEHVTPDEPTGRLLDPPTLPEGERSAVEHFLSRLATGQPFLPLVSLPLGRDTQELLEAGLRAARDGREVALPLGVDA